MNLFPGEGRVAGTQFGVNGFGFVLSGDGDNHSFMNTGEMWRYNPNSDTWMSLTPHPGESRWAPGSFVIDTTVYFFGGLNRLTNIFPNDLWKFDLAEFTLGIDEQALTNVNVYPNPANSFMFWESDKNITNVKVYNALGKFLLMSSTESNQLDIRELENGLYLVQFYAKSELVKTSKVMIQH